MTESRYLIIDKTPGSTNHALLTLEKVLQELQIEQKRENPIKIYEIRDEQPDITHIGFYLTSPNISGFIGPSFWVPQKKKYSDLNKEDGGVGTWGYIKAIALIYRYLTKQPRVIVPARKENLVNMMAYGPETIDKIIRSLEVTDVIEEDESIAKRIFRDGEFAQGFGLNSPSDFSFIVADTETTKLQIGKGPFEYKLGCTWDFYHGLRAWDFNEGEKLVQECDRFDRIVTFNGDKFDINLVFRKFNPAVSDEILRGRSIDLYKIISISCDQQKPFRTRGETNLANIAFATLGLCKWEVYYEPDMETRQPPLDHLVEPQSEEDFGLVDHCARDVEMTKELFFYMLKNKKVYYISKAAIDRKRIIDRIDISYNLKKVLEGEVLQR